jgi:hypothetical protein
MIKKLLILFCVVLVFSCKKSDSPVGVDVLPASDQLKGSYAEIIPKISFTRADDSVITTNVSNSNLLGSMNDPVFGRFDASMYISFEVVGFPPSLGTNPALDSVVLKLNYNTTAVIPILGDTSDPLSLDIFPITEPLNRDSIFYSGRKINYNTNYNLIEGGTKVWVPQPKTQVRINKDDPAYYIPQLRVRLKKEFGEKIFNPAYLSSAGALQGAFPGLFITANRSVLPQPSYGSVVYVNALDSRILLYYHTDNVSGPQSLEIQCGPNCTRYGRFEHDYQFLAEPSLSQQLYPTYDTLAGTPGQQHIYLQGAAGLQAKIDMSDLLKWRDSNVVINKAQLCFTVDRSKPDYYDPVLYPAPVKLYLNVRDPVTGTVTGLYENFYAFGGDFDATNYQYTFNIPHTIAQIISSKKDYTEFYVSVYQTALFPQRVVLGGSSNTSAPVKLKLWYTDLQFPKK